MGWWVVIILYMDLFKYFFYLQIFSILKQNNAVWLAFHFLPLPNGIIGILCRKTLLNSFLHFIALVNFAMNLMFKNISILAQTSQYYDESHVLRLLFLIDLFILVHLFFSRLVYFVIYKNISVRKIFCLYSCIIVTRELINYICFNDFY